MQRTLSFLSILYSLQDMIILLINSCGFKLFTDLPVSSSFPCFILIFPTHTFPPVWKTYSVELSVLCIWTIFPLASIILKMPLDMDISRVFVVVYLFISEPSVQGFVPICGESISSPLAVILILSYTGYSTLSLKYINKYIFSLVLGSLGLKYLHICIFIIRVGELSY